MKRWKLVFLAGCLSMSISTLLPPSPLHAETSGNATSQKEQEKSVGGETGEKGGIYVAGRAFKKAGSEMEKGFKAAGRGIEKGGKTTGRAFKKAGHSIKNFFTGEKD